MKMTYGRMIGAAAGLAVIGGLATLSLSTQTSVTAAARTAIEPAPEGAYKADPVHSSVVFKVKHGGATNFYGTFNDVSATFALGDKANIEATVKADSVDTRNDKRDSHAKSPDFLSAKEFPTISFKAKGLSKSGDGQWTGTGDLTFLGVTKPVQITLNQTGVGSMRGKTLVGVETVFTIKRSEFGNSFMVGPLSDEVTLIVAFEGAPDSESSK